MHLEFAHSMTDIQADLLYSLGILIIVRPVLSNCISEAFTPIVRANNVTLTRSPYL